jgi:glycosyltransferase involved in cell wall biosynthesis
MRAPKVSILIPVFNGEKFLPECLNSILAQDFTDLEILLADDASTDGSAILIESYAARDPRIRWWKNSKNLGLGANWNSCLRVARGDYIKYVLQDDILLSPATVGLMVAELDNNNTVTLVGSASRLVDAESQLIETRQYFKPGIVDGLTIIRQCLERSANWIGEPSVVMFRRAQAERGFDERYRQLIDLEMWFHLLARGKFSYLPEPLCAFRQHAGQQTVVNRRQIIAGTEELMLMQTCYQQPWFRDMFTRQLLFSQIYSLRRCQTTLAITFRTQMLNDFGELWYGIYWLKRKLTQPFIKFCRWLDRRFNGKVKYRTSG